jgi:RNase P subunit RPR2
MKIEDMCVLKKLKKAWEDYQEKVKIKKRKEAILDSCSCVCYCPKCDEPLNDTSTCEVLDQDGLVEYTCDACSTKSKFHFGIAPLPIYMKEEEHETRNSNE